MSYHDPPQPPGQPPQGRPAHQPQGPPPGPPPGQYQQQPYGPQHGYHQPVERRRRIWPWVLGGVLLLFLGGCAVLVVAAGEAVDELDTELEAAAEQLDEELDAAAEQLDQVAPTDDTNGNGQQAGGGDPYERYLQLVDEWAITDAPELSPDDAQARAILGCSSQWAPNTVDAALQEAYAEFLQQYRDQGLCG